MQNIELVLPDAHKKMKITPGMQKEMDDVQRELERHREKLLPGTINFIISKGFYRPKKKVLTIAAVIVNTTEKDIEGIKMDLFFSLKNYPDAKFPKMNAVLNKEFLGVIEKNQAFILHFDVPSENLGEADLVFQPNEITGKVENIEYHYVK
ncbi:hypothetical protein [Virgibacillus sp. YIM 98842]|uniref:hypothetical protein n=1 Tax=Virgibacillus sp. YIM 98842 TaxID=2663533 RepID=UPI0013DBBE42|nr:hypothetical protein [Virgibacillus sp. YIM 98842]